MGSGLKSREFIAQVVTYGEKCVRWFCNIALTLANLLTIRYLLRWTGEWSGCAISTIFFVGTKFVSAPSLNILRFINYTSYRSKVLRDIIWDLSSLHLFMWGLYSVRTFLVNGECTTFDTKCIFYYGTIWFKLFKQQLHENLIT